MAAVEVKKNILTLVPELLKVPYSRIWTSYDKEADVLYINFKKPSHADDCVPRCGTRDEGVAPRSLLAGAGFKPP